MQCFNHPQRVLVTTMLVAEVKAGESLLHLLFSVHALSYVRSVFDLYKYTMMREIAYEIAMLFSFIQSLRKKPRGGSSEDTQLLVNN